MKTGILIKNYRKKSSMSQGFLAKKLGYSNGQFISNWERGVAPIPVHKVREICKLLDIDVDKFKKTMIDEFKAKMEQI